MISDGRFIILYFRRNNMFVTTIGIIAILIGLLLPAVQR